MKQIIVWLKRPDGSKCDAARTLPFDPDSYTGIELEFREVGPPEPAKPFDGVTPLVSTTAGRTMPPPPGQGGGV